MTKYILFTGKHCPGCKAMKLNLDKCGINYTEYSTDEKKGSAESAKYHVRSIPFLVVVDKKGKISTFPGSLPIAEIIKIKDRYK